MERARRHQRGLARLALLLLALVAELAGRSLAHRLDFGRHVETPATSGAEYYPILLAVVKVAVALMLARVAWRFAKARTVARAARRLLDRAGSPRRAALRRASGSSCLPRLWLGSFLVTSLDLPRADRRGGNLGRPLAAARAVAAHLRAAGLRSARPSSSRSCYRAVENWLSDYESYARETRRPRQPPVRRSACPVPRREPSASSSRRAASSGSRSKSRPPPLPA